MSHAPRGLIDKVKGGGGDMNSMANRDTGDTCFLRIQWNSIAIYPHIKCLQIRFYTIFSTKFVHRFSAIVVVNHSKFQRLSTVLTGLRYVLT